MSLDKFGYNISTKKLNCGIKQNIENIYYKYDNIKKEWIQPKKEFSIATWNLWGSEHFNNISLIKERINYIIDILEKNNIDIICLQEVSKFIIDKLMNNIFIKNNYYISSINQPWKSTKMEVKGSEYKDYEPNCWCFTLSKFNIIKSDTLVLKSEKIEFSALVSDIGFATIVNLHLQSGGMGSGKDKKSGNKYHICRKKQIKSIKQFVNKNYANKNIIYLGDYNCDMNKVNGNIFPETKYITNNLNDVWKDCGHKDIDGTTENTYINTMRYNIKEHHKNFRYDAILYKSINLKPKSCKLFGTDKIFDISINKFKKILNKNPILVNDNNRVDWFLSDHFGILASFHIN